MSYGWRLMLAEVRYRTSERAPMDRRRNPAWKVDTTEVRYRTFVRWMMLEASLDEAYALYFLVKSPEGDEGRGGHHVPFGLLRFLQARRVRRQTRNRQRRGLKRA